MNERFTDLLEERAGAGSTPGATPADLAASPASLDLFEAPEPQPAPTGELFPRDIVPVNLRHQTDLEGFSRAARGLVAQAIEPARVSWHVRDARVHDLFASVPQADQPDDAALNPMAPDLPADAPPVQVPALFPPLCETVILHSDPNRFGLLYRLLWRLLHEPGLRHDPLDADRVMAQHMAQAVRRDMHKMKAFVRFRTLAPGPDASAPMHVAWFEPEHHIVEAVAPFFVRRFTQMRWAILT
ncbi:MAG: DUF4130 domain-containing protein, partial [Haliea sp.]